jgi:peptidoglycan-associated lipoprotein
MTNDTLTHRRAERLVEYFVWKGIDSERLIPIGYGSKSPFIVTEEVSNKYNYLPVGQILDKTFIDSLENRDQKEIAHKFNRRTIIKIVQNE